MRVLIDHNPVELNVPAGMLMAGLIEQVRARLAEQKRVLANVTVGGQTVGAGQLEQWRSRPCDQIEQVEFTTACPRRLARQTIREVSALFTESAALQQGASEKLAAGQTGKAMEQLLGCLAIYKAAQEAVSDAVMLNRLDLGSLTVGQQPMGEAISALAGQLAEVKAALISRDLVLLGDLVNYELPKITGQWQAILAELDRHLAD